MPNASFDETERPAARATPIGMRRRNDRTLRSSTSNDECVLEAKPAIERSLRDYRMAEMRCAA